MSRSKKKIPIGWLCSGDHGAMKKWKNQSDRAIRRVEGEIPKGSYYKRFNDPWGSPSDGKCYHQQRWNPEKPWQIWGK